MAHTKNFKFHRGLTLTESTGFLVDAAADRSRREAEQRGASELRSAYAELRALKDEVQQRQRCRRRQQTILALAVSVLALGVGFAVGSLIWSSDSGASDRHGFEASDRSDWRPARRS